MTSAAESAAAPAALAHRLAAIAAWRPEASVEALAVLGSLYFSVVCNVAFWRGALAGAGGEPSHAWSVAGALFVAVTALQALLVCVTAMRRTVRPLLASLLVVAAPAAFFMDRYGVFLDPDMLRNLLHTDSREASELLTPALAGWLLATLAVPLVLLWRVRVRRRPLRVAVLRRSATVAALLAAATAAALVSFQDIAALMRNRHELRYLITPANAIVSALRVAGEDSDARRVPRRPLGPDARLALVPGHRPRLLLLVVGETVRAQNWGLNGYARQTTPELARLDVVNFRDVSACGTSTEVSLPCMFSALGRRHYDAAAIRRSESLLHLLARAGVRTAWRDNQTGCKGVCDGLPFVSYLHADAGPFCDGRRCLDEVLLRGIDDELDAARVDRVIVLHQLGNHGPAYASRYPADFRRFVPDCASAQLGDCSRQEIVNAYDNAILYTDHFLAEAIRLLQSRTDYDAALLYVSDHGESLGENRLYLHGVPYAIAPDVQLKVPMVAWLSPSLRRAQGIDAGCLHRLGERPASHDDLFSSVLGLLQVRTSLYAPERDLFAPCATTGLAASGIAGAPRG